MHPATFEPAIPASEGPQTNVLDRDWDRLYIDVPFVINVENSQVILDVVKLIFIVFNFM
jgi:hypothetical protein